jgi:hypothetical protein
MMNIDEEMTLEGTILEPYETIFFDVDGVIFDAFTSKGESIGCYRTNAPYQLQARDVVIDVTHNIIRLHHHLREVFEVLDNNNINMGICSRGEKRNTPFGAQPTTMLLKKFDIYKYFNLDVILKEGITKSEYIKPMGKTLFIDDSEEQLQDVGKHPDIDILNRNAFSDWLQLLQPKHTSSLCFGLAHFAAIQELKLG